MTYKEISELVKLVNKTNLTEFKIKQGEFELSIRTEKYNRTKTTQVVAPQQQIMPIAAAPMPAVAQAYAPPAAAPAETAPATENKKVEAPAKETKGNYLEVKSPIVGTFYRSSSPEKGPYVKVGDTIEVGQTVCIVEAMKLFNEIETEVAGKVVKVMVEDAQPVEYDQVLFLVEPN